MKRSVMPEILDGLAADDPEALRSRRDLRMINGVMGNLRWVRRQVERFDPEGVVEIGAGDGGLLAGLHKGGRRKVLGIDLAPRPASLPEAVDWVQGDVFESFQPRDCVVANLFLHHFEEARLRELGAALRECSVLCICEPLRARFAMAEGYALFPLVNRVTRHDMIVSIRAGFRRGELTEILGVDGSGWNVREGCTALGAYRLLAWRGTR
jgi:SAM-dependent methyltransferase